MTDQQPMPAGWYQDPAQFGHQREWNGSEWVGPSVPVQGQKRKGGFLLWMIPVIACLGLGFIAVVGGAIASSGDEDQADTVRTERSTTTDEPTTTERSTTIERETTEPETTEAPTTTEAATTTAPPTTAPPTTPPPPPPPTAPPETVSQANARGSASDYLEYSAFSRTGLIEQLEYEGFSPADATYGVDAQGADWNEQAAKSAAQYLEYTSFSRSGLIDQLIYEGFTPAEAEYGVGTTGL